ncbi:MAG: aldolase/citrate lyase family protein [Chloroflexota bacterium]
MRSSAGQRGAEVRSDCWVEVEESSSPTIQLTSRVEVMYGDSIRQLAQATLRDLKSDDLSLTIDDSGALPYVIMARIESAVKRLRPANPTQVLPPLNPKAQHPLSPNRLRRTRLYLPGNTPKFFINAGLHQPDAVILDLEDSVPPSEKDSARLLARNALRAVNFFAAEKMVRVNSLPQGLEDVRFIAEHGVQTILIPKVESAEEVIVIEQDLRGFGNLEGLKLIPIIESAKGVLNAYAIATASPRVVALSIGLEDYATDIGAQRTKEGKESFWARSMIVNAARAAGIQPLASVFSDMEDETGLRTFVEDSKALGFEGIGCLHPRQVKIAHEMFAPKPEDVEKAKRIVTAFDEAQAKGIGAISVDGKMVDAPIVERARKVLRLAQIL